MHVIFNADDFGLTPGINLGIEQACQHGVVRSTTMMVGMAAEQHALQVASAQPSLAVGLHLRFTAGLPLTTGGTIIGNDGHFLAKELFWQTHTFKEQEIADEVVAQVERFLATGLSLSHVDSHHHAHMHPRLLPVIEEIVAGYQVPLRGRLKQGKDYVFSQNFYGESLSVDKLLALIGQYRGKCDVLEVMCHPAYIDQPLLDASGYALPRAMELDILTDVSLRESLDKWGVTVGSFLSIKE